MVIRLTELEDKIYNQKHHEVKSILMKIDDELIKLGAEVKKPHTKNEYSNICHLIEAFESAKTTIIILTKRYSRMKHED